MNKTFASVALLAAHFLSAWRCDAATITIQTDQPGHAVSPTLWGIFFEDINLSADGGVYPELVRNRSFEDAARPDQWKLANQAEARTEMSIDTARPLNPMNPRSLRLNIDGAFTLENRGYYGMGVQAGETYRFRFAARAERFSGPLVVKLLGADDRELATGEIRDWSDAWHYSSIELRPAAGDPKARLQLSAAGKGTLYLDMVSLLPKTAWKQSGLRPDLAEAMAALRPAFLRFPGGCWVEGETLDRMYNWKKTIGAVDVRTSLWNIWDYNAHTASDSMSTC